MPAVKIKPILADTGRPAGSAVNLLNAGWTHTMAMPLPEGGFTLPGQALAVFLEASWDQLNRPHRLVLELLDDEGTPARFPPLPDGAGPPVRVEQEIVVAPVPNAPNGTPGMTTYLLDIPPGTLRLSAARRSYTWRVSIAGANAEVGFWVDAPMSGPVIGDGLTQLPNPGGP